ncbi:MAG TPA: hypothetical protein VD788_16955 [Candidatus Polarisedimenticolaceae bacterium]|nr:hypothetical protein [Candidatus Polarisedimenticolaceae bacterium]
MAALAVGTPADEGQRFENATAGISLERPAGWVTASIQQVEANRKRVRLPDDELQAAVEEHASAPLFVFTRYPEPHDDLNPSIQVILRPLGELAGLPPIEVMQAAVGPLQEIFGNFEFVEEIHPTEVAGYPAARMSATYTIENDEGRAFETVSKMWIVPRGSFMFMLGMSGAIEDRDELEEIFERAIGSVEIAD